jgi:urea transport system substrate-binding protein
VFSDSPHDQNASKQPHPDTQAEGAAEEKEDTMPSYAGILAAPIEPGEIGWLAHYRVLRVLGRGGMGMVFQAEDTHLQRLVALKVILPQYAVNTSARERFLREARACAALKNDHIVTIYQVGQDRDIPYLAMEFLQGETLEDRVLSGLSVPVREILRIGREAAEGLAAAHERGLIHRDVKPANIWLEAPAGRVKLLDFGLARAVGTSSELTQTGIVVGTPAFMSPEQGRGEPVDARSDLFSLGAILYTLCTGDRPFQGSNVMAILTALATTEPAPILNPEIPAALADLITRLMAKDPSNRPSTALEVAELLRALEAEITSGSTSVPSTVAYIGSQKRWKTPARNWGLLAGALAVLTLIGGITVYKVWPESSPVEQGPPPPSGPPIRIGVLHSKTGTMAISERPVIDAVQFAVEEINAKGGVLGRPVEAVVVDGKSDEDIFARQAEKLITTEKVSALFGCWTSASRKAVLPVVEKHDHLLLYPVQYEGIEQSPNIIYLGPVPNQQIIPALRWLVGFEGKRRWILVGSDYVFPRAANAVIRDEAKARGDEIAGEEYIPLGSNEVGPIVDRIVKLKPDLIVNTINGDANVSFFRALRRAGIKTKEVPTVSFSMSAAELSILSDEDVVGDYMANSYFSSLETATNQKFRERYGKYAGTDQAISAPMGAAYAGVYLWAQAVRAAGRDEPRAVRAALKGQEIDAPQGLMRIDPATQHTVQHARVGRIAENDVVNEVYRSPHRVDPEPFPASRSRKDWVTFLDGLHRSWNGRWSNSGR